jgi:CubicO group peptidase (beta-lactamase class C family)
MATLPLLYQPGPSGPTACRSTSRVISSKNSGKTFPEFLRYGWFEPLGMVDTGFSVPLRSCRASTIYSYDKAKAGLAERSIQPFLQLPGLPSGGGGLYGTGGLFPLRADAAQWR